MGRIGTIGMAEAVGDMAINLEAAVSWQLQSNHYPPVPQTMVGSCCEAIMAVADDEAENDIDLPDGITYRNDAFAPAWAIVEAHHLGPFVDMVMEEWTDDDEGDTT